MNLIVLDFDGVLTSIDSGTHFFLMDDLAYKPCKKLVNKVKKLCDETGSKIMIASNWRKYDTDHKHFYRGIAFDNQLPKLRKMLKGYLFEQDLPNIPHTRKGECLKIWLKDNPDFTGNFVILDDADYERYDKLRYKNIRKKFIQVDPKTGFSDDDYEKAVKILTSTTDN